MSDCFSLSSATSNTVTYFYKLEPWEFCFHGLSIQSRGKDCVDMSRMSWSRDAPPPGPDEEPAGPARPS